MSTDNNHIIDVNSANEHQTNFGSGWNHDFLDLSLNNLHIEDDEAEDEAEDGTHLKAIPLQQYNDLMQLIPQVEKLKNTVKRLKNAIKLKDAQLRESNIRDKQARFEMRNYSKLPMVIMNQLVISNQQKLHDNLI